MILKFRRLLIVVVCSLTTHISSGQSLDGYAGLGIGCDEFIRDKAITPKASTAPFLFSPQIAAGIRLHPKTDFILMLDATLGLSNIALMSANTDERITYQQVRSLITIGSGLYLPLERDRYIMPFINLGTGFYDYSGLATKKYGATLDYSTNRWTAVCGAGFEYKCRIFIPSVINFRFLYTPLDIFPEPFKYTVANSKGAPVAYELQGKLLQFFLTYQIPFRIHNWNKDY